MRKVFRFLKCIVVFFDGADKTMDENFGLIVTVEKAAQIYMLTAHLPGVNTIHDEEMVELAEFFGVKYRKDFLNL